MISPVAEAPAYSNYVAFHTTADKSRRTLALEWWAENRFIYVYRRVNPGDMWGSPHVKCDKKYTLAQAREIAHDLGLTVEEFQR